MRLGGVLLAVAVLCASYSDVAQAMRNGGVGTDMRQSVECTYGYVDGVLSAVLCQVAWVNDFNVRVDVYESRDWLDTFIGEPD